MSSIRLFILGNLASEGDMHGHQLRQLAEKQHVGLWTDITVGGLYGALKRLAAEKLIDEKRVERDGSYPERQVWTITDAGRAALSHLRATGLSEIVFKPDPFDLAMTRLDPENLDDLAGTVAARIQELRHMLLLTEEHQASVAPRLTPSRLFLMTHRVVRLEAEIAWHEALLDKLPEIISDEKSRKAV